MDFRKIFDTIPEQFDQWRPCYCKEAFADLIRYAQLDAEKSALEIGPGTGQATEPVLKTGCRYLAIELGEHLAAYTKRKFASYENFHIIHADFETHDFGEEKFDLIYSAASIQWIPEEIGFARAFDLLKSGGSFAMMLMKGDFKTPNPALFNRIQEVYQKYFHPETPYTQKLEYTNAANYGLTGLECRKYSSHRVFRAEEYVAYLGTHCDHIGLKEPERSKFYEGIRQAILEAGDQLVFYDTIVLYLAKKP